VRQDVRPERPDDEDAPQLSDAVRELAQSCWLKDPKHRITANTVCDIIAHILTTATVTPPKLVPPSSHPITMPPAPARASLLIPRAPIPPPDLTQLLRMPSIGQPLPIHSPSHSNSLTQAKSLPPIPVQANLPSPLTPPLHLTIRGHSDTVYCAAFSQNGKYIASGSGDYTSVVWDAQTENPALGPLKLHNRAACCVASLPMAHKLPQVL
jgi:WD40 repeat protein